MKDCRMGWQPNNTDSVIARLMGFDELRPRPRPSQPLREKCRVLSASYIHKSGTVGVRQGSLISIVRSRSTKSNIVPSKNNIVHGVKSNGEDDIALENCTSSTTAKVKMGIRITEPSDASILKSLAEAKYQGIRSDGRRGEYCARGNVQGYLQKLEHSSVAGHHGELRINYMNKTSKFRSKTIVKPCLYSAGVGSFKRKSEKGTYGFKVVKLDVHSRAGYTEQKESLRPESGNHHPESTSKEIAVNAIIFPRRSCIACIRNMKRNSQQVQSKSKFAEVLKTGYKGDSYLLNDKHRENTHSLHLSLNHSSVPIESQTQNFERRTTAKVVKEVGFFRRDQSLGTLSSGWNLAHDKSSHEEKKSKGHAIPEEDILEAKGGRDCDRFQASPSVTSNMSLHSEMSEYFQGIQNADSSSLNDSHTEIELSQRNSKLSQCIDDDSYASAEASCTEVCSGINGDSRLEPNPCILSAVGGYLSYVHEVSSVETSLNEFSEDESAYSNSSRIGPTELLDNVKRAHQHSPNSVLEPFHGQNSSAFECLDSIGQCLLVQTLNFETEETCSEGSVIGVSGDEDSEEHFANISHDGREVKRWIGDDKSKNFSYLVDVLDEAGSFGMESFMDFSTWHSLDCPISPTVFEALEKKYGQQAHWLKSERHLLFDRINSGLIGIFNPEIDFHTSLRRTLCANLRRDEVEDELWMMLISQEEQKRRDLAEKAVEKWLEAEEGMNLICRELEVTLFDELVIELASLWN